jgi:hypothetical protein
LFSLSWLHRQVRIYFEHGIGHRANVSLVANGFICVRIPTTATWGVGQHFFVRFLSLGIHAVSIHPFTACSLPAENSSYDTTTSELVLYIRPQGGFTARLAKHAETHPNSTIRVLLDGPYGGIHGQTLSSSTRQLVVAGGSGAGWLLPMISTFLRDHQHSIDAAAEPSRSAKVVLATRDAATHEWFEETVLELLSTFGLEKVPANLEIELYYTGAGQDQPDTKADAVSIKLDEAQATVATEKQPVERAGSDSSSEVARAKSLKRFNGRPDLQSMVHAESTSPTLNGQLGVFVCGPASMQIDTSNAVAAEQLAILRGGRNDVYLHMEHFSWA